MRYLTAVRPPPRRTSPTRSSTTWPHWTRATRLINLSRWFRMSRHGVRVSVSIRVYLW